MFASRLTEYKRGDCYCIPSPSRETQETMAQAATIIEVDYRQYDRCSPSFDEEFPFLLQGRVDPDRYAETICTANDKMRSATNRTWIGLVIFFICCIPAIVLIPLTINTWGLWALSFEIAILGFAFVFLFFIIFSVRRARLSLECFLREENRNYYNPIGINFKYRQLFRHARIDIEVLHAAPQPVQQTTSKISETSPLVFASQQLPQPSFGFNSQPIYLHQQPYSSPYVQNN